MAVSGQRALDRSKLLFGCMYEDAEIDLRVFQPDGRVFCIALLAAPP